MNCKDFSAVAVCYTNAAGIKQSLVAHYEYRNNAAGVALLHATRYTDSAGVPVNTSAGTVSVGACVVAAPDVEYQLLCDTSAAGVVTSFFRRAVSYFDATGAVSVVVADFAIDKTTPYATTGIVGDCEVDCAIVPPVGLVATWG